MPLFPLCLAMPFSLHSLPLGESAANKGELGAMWKSCLTVYITQLGLPFFPYFSVVLAAC